MSEAAYIVFNVEPYKKPKPKPKAQPQPQPKSPSVLSSLSKNPVRTRSQSVKHSSSFVTLPRVSRSGSTSKHAISTNKSSSSSNSNFESSNSKETEPPPLTAASKESHDRMFLSSSSTPLPDYKHSANQSTKTRTQAQAQANRISSSTGGSSRSKHASSIADSQAAMAARGSDAAGRSSSISSNTASSALTQVTSSEPPAADAMLAKPFAIRYGKRYLRDTTLPYPLPCDLTELHRQTLRTMLMCQVFNGPVCSPAFDNKPPKRVLEAGCGTGFWSVMCHRHFSQRGFSSIMFTGIDLAPLAPRMDADDDMNWRFIQHDLQRAPLPLRDEEFDLVMIKDLSLMMPITESTQVLMDEYLRVLKPGGTLEIWDGDHCLRMLLPHTPPSTKESPDDSEDEEQVHTNAMGTYTLTPATPLAIPHNQYLADYNSWIIKAFEARGLPPTPSTILRPLLLQEADVLVEIDQRRLAIPLGEVRWEREGVGGAGTGAEGLAISSKGKSREPDRKHLTPGQAALRRTALLTVVQMIESLEPVLKEVSGKGQDEWDRWQGNMMNDLLNNNGTSWGECLEIGAWWGRKRKPSA